MKKYILLSLSLLALLCSSCEEVIDYELRTADTKLVIEGLITDQPGPYTVRISNTKGYLDQGKTPGVNSALVIISDNKGVVDTLKQIDTGFYQTTKLQGKPGNTYFLKVKVGGQEYTAQTYMPAVSPIDSLTFEDKKAGNGLEAGLHPMLYMSDPAGKGHYYRWNIYVNGVKEWNIAVASDEIYDGSSAKVDLWLSLKQGDKVKVELLSLDKAAYDFWYALAIQQNATGGPFDSTPANAPGNISNGAMGFFGASAVSSVEATAKASK